MIRPTERGAAFMQAAYEALAEIEAEWVGAVGAEALARLRDGLAQVRTVHRRAST